MSVGEKAAWFSDAHAPWADEPDSVSPPFGIVDGWSVCSDARWLVCIREDLGLGALIGSEGACNYLLKFLAEEIAGISVTRGALVDFTGQQLVERINCDACRATGLQPCADCHGRGHVSCTCPTCDFEHSYPCPDCDARGRRVCRRCGPRTSLQSRWYARVDRTPLNRALLFNCLRWAPENMTIASEAERLVIFGTNYRAVLMGIKDPGGKLPTFELRQPTV